MPDDQAEEYDDGHRAFLQAFLGRGTLTLDEAKPIIAAIWRVKDDSEANPGDVVQDDLDAFIAAVNPVISKFDFSIRSTLSQRDRTRVYALVNTTSDAITQLATTHTADEIAYVKRLLDAIFETFNTGRQEVMAITSMQAVRLHKSSGDDRRRNEGTQTNDGQGLTMAAAEKVLKDLVREGWLEKSRAGFFTLSPRALIELKHYLLSTYNHPPEEEEEDEAESRRYEKIKLCAACKDIVTMGQRCPNRECSIRLHEICTAGFFRVQRSETCPSCKRSWSGHGFVGERAVTTTDAHGPSRRSITTATSSSRRRSSGRRVDTRRPTSDEDDNDDDDDDDA